MGFSRSKYHRGTEVRRMKRALLIASLLALPAFGQAPSEKTCGVRPATRSHRAALLPRSAAPVSQDLAPASRESESELDIQRECKLWIKTRTGVIEFADTPLPAPAAPAAFTLFPQGAAAPALLAPEAPGR
jgi:hypothetical protein